MDGLPFSHPAQRRLDAVRAIAAAHAVHPRSRPLEIGERLALVERELAAARNAHRRIVMFCDGETP